MDNFMFKTRGIATGTIMAGLLAGSFLLTSASSVGAHTGSISSTKDCENGNQVLAQLDSNVAEGAEFTVRINDEVVDSGNGPGPRELGPYDVGFSAGDASLTISFNEENNVYITEFGAVTDCQEETPSPSPTATPSPKPTSSPRPTGTPSSSPSTTPKTSTKSELPEPSTTTIPDTAMSRGG